VAAEYQHVPRLFRTRQNQRQVGNLSRVLAERAAPAACVRNHDDVGLPARQISDGSDGEMVVRAAFAAHHWQDRAPTGAVVTETVETE
jgi:hypothetical protein